MHKNQLIIYTIALNLSQVSVRENFIWFRKFKKLSQQEIGNVIGITRQAISAIEKGKQGVSADVIMALLKAYPELNPDWFMLSNGEMLRHIPKYQLNLGDNTKIGAMINGDNANVAKAYGQYNVDPSAYVKKLENKIEEQDAEIQSLKEELMKAKDKIISLMEK